MAEYQEPIRNDKLRIGYNWRNNYVYVCNACGKEVAGYSHKRVRGHVLCYDCRRRLANTNYESKEYKRGFDDAMKSITAISTNEYATFLEDFIQLEESEKRLIADVTHCILENDRKKGKTNDKDMVSADKS